VDTSDISALECNLGLLIHANSVNKPKTHSRLQLRPAATDSKIDMARVLTVKRRIMPVRIGYISSALCQINTVRCERFRSDWVILDDSKPSQLLSREEIYTGVPFAPVCAPSVAHPAASSSHPIYQCGIGGAKLQQEVQRILHNTKRMKGSKATLP